MVKKMITIADQGGLHLRPAGQLCQRAIEYPCKIQMVIGNKTFNLKSVLSVLSAQVTGSQVIELICDGEQEEQALEKIACFLEGKDEPDRQ